MARLKNSTVFQLLALLVEKHKVNLKRFFSDLKPDFPGRGLQDQSDIHDVFISYRRNNGSHLAR